MLAAAAAAAMLAGCGIRVSTEPSPSARPATVVVTSPVVSPAPPAGPPGLAPVAPPSAGAEAALATAARRVQAAADVRRALPTFDQLAASMVARSGVPGAAVAVVAGDAVAYARCFGLRRIGSPDEITDDTLFQLGAVSRSYTTTMLAALAGEGEVRWDQPVRRAWPGFRLRDRWATRAATFRDLTAQRSGLPAYAGAELLQFGYGREEVLRRLRYLRPAAGFRAARAPQDAVFTAAAVAAERATGDSWARLMRTRVLQPIGDERTMLSYRGYMAAENRAAPHRLAAGAMVAQKPSNETVLAPSLGVSSSLSGLVPFARLQLNGGALGGVRVAPAGPLGQTLAPTTAAGAGSGYEAGAAISDPTVAALGWLVRGFDERLVASAEGGLATGTGAVVSLVPSDGIAVIVLANAYPEGVVLGRALTKTLLDLAGRGVVQQDWLGHEQALAVEAATVSQAVATAGGAGGGAVDDANDPAGPGREGGPGLVLPPQAPAGVAAPRARSVYEGVYTDRYYGRVTVRPAPGGGLNVRLGRGETLRYVPWNRDIWRDSASGTAAVFAVRGGKARSVALTRLTFDGRRGAFVRVD